MAKQVPWNAELLAEFARLAMLSELEYGIMETRIKGMCRTEQARKFGLSIDSIDKKIKLLKQKYDRVQPLSDKLPKRVFSAKEVWMDTH